MALNNSQYDTIIRAYEQKQLHNRNVLDKRYKTVYNRLPELKEINDSISLLSVNHARKLLDGDESALPALKEEIRKLSEQKKTLLLSAGFPAGLFGAGLRMRRLQRYRIHRQSKMSLFPQSSHRSALYTIQFTAYFGKKKILIHFLFLTTQIIILTQKPGALLSQI